VELPLRRFAEVVDKRRAHVAAKDAAVPFALHPLLGIQARRAAQFTPAQDRPA